MKTRKITFELDGNEEFSDFGTYALIIFYAKQLSFANGKKLIEASLTKSQYRFEYELPERGIIEDDPIAHFVVNEIEDVVLFINNQLIPSLNLETTDLIDKYGGKSNFLKKYYTNSDYLYFFGICEDEFFEGDAKQLAHWLGIFSEFLQKSISQNKAYSIYVD